MIRCLMATNPPFFYTLQQSCGIFVSYLLNYPMTEERLEQHLKQIVLNIKYEHAEGRLSAVSLMATVIDKLPLPVLQKHSQLFFFPLTLQLANDDAKECREAIAKCLSKLMERLSTDMLQSLYDYTERWAQGDGALRRTSLQLYGIFLESRVDFMRRGDTASRLLERLQKILSDGGDEWEATYFSLICLEKISVPFNDLFERQTEIWPLIIDCLKNRHPWVKLASSRIISKHLTSKDVDTLLNESSKTFLLDVPGSLFQVARNLCYQINSDEDQQDDDLTAVATKSLTWALKAANKYPHLCFADDEEDGDTAEKKRDPILWIMTRLSNTARPRGTKRRQAVFKCFAAFATFCSDIVLPHLELMLEPLHRSEMEAKNELEVPALMLKKRPTEDTISEEAQLAKDLMHILEEHCDSQDTFLGSYAAVKTKARDKKDRRKLEEKTQAIVDPEGAAKRRILKQEGEKKRRKRRVDEHRVLRGGVAKRRHIED
jgi:U3 small nucleolar RNA-associated protein 20